MEERKQETDSGIVPCPVCGGDGKIRGPKTGMTWFACGFCYGTGGITAARFYAWQGRNSQSPVTDG